MHMRFLALFYHIKKCSINGKDYYFGVAVILLLIILNDNTAFRN